MVNPCKDSYGPAAGTGARILVVGPNRSAPPGADTVADLIWDLGRRAESALRDAGAATVTAVHNRPVLLPSCDGLLLTGGGDVDPRLYGGPRDHPSVSHVDAARDRFELAVLEDALAAGVPVLALCRGLQLLNVALGGSLMPQVRQDVVHHHGSTPATLMVTHPVEIAENTGLGRTLGRGRHTVWSGHHQAIDRLGTGLTVTAQAADGVIEAVEHTSAPVVGVQWHPEFGHVPGKQPDQLFVGLAEQARQPRAQRQEWRPTWR